MANRQHQFQAEFAGGVDFRVLVPRFNTLAQQTMERIKQAGLAEVSLLQCGPSAFESLAGTLSFADCKHWFEYNLSHILGSMRPIGECGIL